jgi:hypothetical protein
MLLEGWKFTGRKWFLATWYMFKSVTFLLFPPLVPPICRHVSLAWTRMEGKE